MPKISSISIEIRARTKKFIRGLRNAIGSIKRFTSALLGGMANIIKFGAIITAVAVGALVVFLKKSAATLDLLAKTARAIKLNINVLNGLQFAASRAAGIGAEAMNKALETLNRRLGEAKTNFGSGATAFRAFGLDIKKFQNLNLEETFFEITKIINDTIDPTEQAAIAFQFFGRQGGKLLNVIRLGEDAIKAFIEESKRIKGVFTDEDLKRVEMMNDAMADTKEAFESIFDRINTIIAPLVTFIAENLTNAFVKFREEIQKAKSAIIEGLIQALVRTGMTIIAIGKVFESFGNAVIVFFAKDGKSATESFMDGMLTAIGTIGFFVDQMTEAKGSVADDFKDLGKIIAIAFSTPFEVVAFNFQKFIGDAIQGLFLLGNLLGGLFKTLATVDIIKVTTGQFAEEIDSIFQRAEIEKKQARLSAGKFKVIDDEVQKQFDDLIKNSTKQQAGALSKLLEGSIVTQDIKKFVEKFKKEVGLEGKDLEIKIRKFFETLSLDLEGGGDIVSELAGLQNQLPKLAIKGSQEAAKGEAGVIGVQQEQLVIQKKQLKAQKDNNKLLEAIASANAILGALSLATQAVVDPFNVSNQVGGN